MDSRNTQQLQKFGFPGVAKAAWDLQKHTGASMSNCYNCIIKASYDCKEFSKEALFELAIAYLKQLPL